MLASIATLVLGMLHKNAKILHFDPIITPGINKRRNFLIFHPRKSEYELLKSNFSTLQRIIYKTQTIAEKYSARAAGKIITVSDAIAEKIYSDYGIKEKRNKIVNIWGGVNKDLFKPTGTKPADNYIFAPNLFRSQRKGAAFAAEVFRNLYEKYNIRAKIVVTGKVSKDCFSSKALLERYADVKTLGTLPYEDIPHLYYNAMFTIMPSRLEGLGLVALECAAAGGIPVVSEQVPAKNILKDVGGIILPLETEEWTRVLKTLIENEETRKSIRNTIIENRDKLPTWNDIANTLIKEIT